MIQSLITTKSFIVWHQRWHVIRYHNYWLDTGDRDIGIINTETWRNKTGLYFQNESNNNILSLPSISKYLKDFSELSFSHYKYRSRLLCLFFDDSVPGTILNYELLTKNDDCIEEILTWNNVIDVKIFAVMMVSELLSQSHWVDTL